MWAMGVPPEGASPVDRVAARPEPSHRGRAGAHADRRREGRPRARRVAERCERYRPREGVQFKRNRAVTYPNDQATCAHIWITNSGRGGDPRFNIRMVGDVLPVMHVMCSECGARAFFTEKNWYALRERQAREAAEIPSTFTEEPKR